MKVKLKMINMISPMEMMQTCIRFISHHAKSKQQRAKEIDVPSNVLVCQATVNYNV